MVLSNTRSIAAFILPFGVAQKPKYLTASDSGVRGNGSSRYVTVTASIRLATVPSIAISFVLVVFTWIPLQASNSWTAFMSCCIFASFCASSVMSSANSIWQNGAILGSPWPICSLLPMSSRYLESALIKSENRRGESTLPWATPVLKVIFALPTFPCGRRTVVCS